MMYEAEAIDRYKEKISASHEDAERCWRPIRQITQLLGVDHAGAEPLVEELVKQKLIQMIQIRSGIFWRPVASRFLNEHKAKTRDDLGTWDIYELLAWIEKTFTAWFTSAEMSDTAKEQGLFFDRCATNIYHRLSRLERLGKLVSIKSPGRKPSYWIVASAYDPANPPKTADLKTLSPDQLFNALKKKLGHVWMTKLEMANKIGWGICAIKTSEKLLRYGIIEKNPLTFPRGRGHGRGAPITQWRVKEERIELDGKAE